MVEKQIQLEVLIANLHANLLPNESKAVSQFHQKFSQVQKQPSLEVRFTMGFRQIDEVEKIAVFEDAAGV